MKKNEPISTTTLNELCLILECPVEQILKFEADKEEVKQISEKRKNIPAKKIKN